MIQYTKDPIAFLEKAGATLPASAASVSPSPSEPSLVPSPTPEPAPEPIVPALPVPASSQVPLHLEALDLIGSQFVSAWDLRLELESFTARP